MLALCSSLVAFTPGPVGLRAPVSVSRSTEPVLSQVDRRAVVNGALFAVSAFVAAPANAQYGMDKDFCQSYDMTEKNVKGEAALYTPKAKYLASGSKFGKIEVTMPSPGPLSAGDYIDAMWVKDTKSGAVLDARFYYPNGKPMAKGRSGAPADGSAPIEPTFTAKVPAGGPFVPVVKSAAGYVWEGAPVS